MSHRREQFESTLQRALGKLLAGGLNDPRVAGLVSVTRVKVSDDGLRARVGVSVLPEEKQKGTVHGLRHAAGHIRRLLDNEMRARAMPHLDFYADDSLKKQARVLNAIREAVGEEAEEDHAGADDEIPNAPTPPSEDPPQ